jgi:hypothetical protein
MKSRSTTLPACRNGMLFDNSLNDERFRIDIRVENGYEEDCKRGADDFWGYGFFRNPFSLCYFVLFSF